MNPIRWIRNGSRTCYSLDRLSRRVSYSKSSQQIPTQWLRQMLKDRTKPPRLYAWTLANLPDDTSHGDNPVETQKFADERRRIYVLGVGNIGRLYASFLAKNTPRPPITLVVHRSELLEHWRDHPGIELVCDSKPETNTEFDIEWWTDEKPPQGPVREPANGAAITNLIVATKASDALPQVDRLRRYLDARSTVAFTQNGMCKLWPPLGDAYIAARFPRGGPTWLACVTTHGVTSQGPFQSVHASPADVLVGTVMTGGARSDDLAAQIVGAPGLAARRVSTRELWVAQLEKLVVNSVINPLTAILRCKNGELFAQKRDDDGLAEVMDVLLEEASRTLQALVAHPSSDYILSAGYEATADGNSSDLREQLLERFSFPRLRAMLYGVAAKVGENTSSMLQDMRAGKKTEVEDFNGWLVETAKFLGDDRGLPGHEMMVSLVEYGKMLTPSDLVGIFFEEA
ncbi:6-phosphogluconate dehydrogenase C-terminal domain-like protein [Hypoxylon crocopeplum]|nr:6-phosphogluconate dehydrogenase C-terminal domain-like protein [Hypoxylon crocopeplum]